MRAIYIDAGTRDEWYLDLGAQAFVDELTQIGVDRRRPSSSSTPPTRGIDYRYPIGLAYLAERLSVSL